MTTLWTISGDYARRIGAPVRTGTDVTRIATSDGGFSVETSDGSWRARNVVLATGGYQNTEDPGTVRGCPASVLQLHTHDYRNPEQLPDGAVLIVGTGQSGGQIAEDLLAAGREVHLAVSTCPEAPRRYRGHDIIYWILQAGIHGPEYGLNALTVGQLPSPAARFACNPLLSGTDGGHDIHLRDLGRKGVRLHGHLEAADDGELTFRDDLPERLGNSRVRVRPAHGAGARRLHRRRRNRRAGTPAGAGGRLASRSASPRLNLAAENITSVLWATGYRLDFSFVDIPVLDEWSYPRHVRGVTEQPGLYAVGLPWLTGHGSSIVAGVGRDAKYIAEHIAGR